VRVFIDSNIILSAALFPDGEVAKVLFYLLKTHTIIISSYSIRECDAVFTRKFPEKITSLKTFFESLEYERFETPANINIQDYPSMRDISDIPVLASAILSDADILLTGDKDFTAIKMKKPLIFTPNQYFQLINNKGNN
jgi:putative PIN family toxin of toxin-antitoxin system